MYINDEDLLHLKEGVLKTVFHNIIKKNNIYLVDFLKCYHASNGFYLRVAAESRRLITIYNLKKNEFYGILK